MYLYMTLFRHLRHAPCRQEHEIKHAALSGGCGSTRRHWESSGTSQMLSETATAFIEAGMCFAGDAGCPFLRWDQMYKYTQHPLNFVLQKKHLYMTRSPYSVLPDGLALREGRKISLGGGEGRKMPLKLLNSSENRRGDAGCNS